MTTQSVRVQRDNLNIGLSLARNPHGEELDWILQDALGYDPVSPHTRDHYDSRLRTAQAVGRDAFRDRRPGYFTFNAQPFGRIWVYKVTWYVWINPQTGEAQTVPIPSGDLRSMRERRDKELDTRTGTSRSIRAAHDIEDEKKAIQQQGFQDLRAVQQRMLEDGSLGEILSGLHGLPYADIEAILPRLPDANFASVKLNFQRTARKIRRLQNELQKEHERISDQLMNWVMLQTGLPSNAAQLAFQDAQHRLSRL